LTPNWLNVKLVNVVAEEKNVLRAGDPVAVFVTVSAAVAAVAEVIVGVSVLTTFPVLTC